MDVRRWGLCLLTLGFLLVSCNRGPVEGTAPTPLTRSIPASLAGTRWQLVASVEPNGRRVALAGAQPVTLDFTANAAGGEMWCNFYSGAYRIEDGRIEWSNLRQTLIGCDGDRVARDRWYFATLAVTRHYDMVGDRLRLILSDGGWLEYVARSPEVKGPG